MLFLKFSTYICGEGTWKVGRTVREYYVKTRFWKSKQGIAPGGAARRYASHADGSSIQKSRRIYVRPWTGPQSAHLWRLAVAKLQAVSVPIAEAAAPWTDGRIALGQGAKK